MTAILTRRSEHYLIEPAPSEVEFIHLLDAAAIAPDHGRLRPWRWILVRGQGRQALGACFAADSLDGRPEGTAAKAMRAPLLATLVFAPYVDHKVPGWEQLAATSAMASSLMLLLHARGFGSIWRTGSFVDSYPTRLLLDLTQTERLLGWLYIGTPDPTKSATRRPYRPVKDRVSTFEHVSGSTAPPDALVV